VLEANLDFCWSEAEFLLWWLTFADAIEGHRPKAALCSAQ